MKVQAAFRDVALPVRVGTQCRFWLLSAKPVFDNAGKFLGYHGAGADVTEKRLADERIIHLARYDSVTGLPNRVSFQEEIDRALGDARERGQPAAMLCLDLDQFKSINDTPATMSAMPCSNRSASASERARATATSWPGSAAMSLRSCK